MIIFMFANYLKTFTGKRINILVIIKLNYEFAYVINSFTTDLDRIKSGN